MWWYGTSMPVSQVRFAFSSPLLEVFCINNQRPGVTSSTFFQLLVVAEKLTKMMKRQQSSSIQEDLEMTSQELVMKPSWFWTLPGESPNLSLSLCCKAWAPPCSELLNQSTTMTWQLGPSSLHPLAGDWSAATPLFARFELLNQQQHGQDSSLQHYHHPWVPFVNLTRQLEHIFCSSLPKIPPLFITSLMIVMLPISLCDSCSQFKPVCIFPKFEPLCRMLYLV